MEYSFDQKTMRSILHLNGLKISPANAAISDYRIQYKIPIFQLKALGVFSKKKPTALWSGLPNMAVNQGHYVELDLDGPVDFYMRRAMREARKAVYALSLEFALVHIGILGWGDTIVIDVNPSPKLNHRMTEWYTEARNEQAAEQNFAERSAKADRIMLGADPEFILRKPNGKIVSADRFMGREGSVGCDAVVLSGHRIVLPLVELRPEPSASPIALTRNLQSLMQRAEKMINEPDLDWIAGAMPVKGLPLGGHIHFSGLELTSELLRVLDNYLALPLVMIEDESVNRRRPRYGFLGDFRRQSHGGFEYRSLPSWLASPQITVGVLSLAFVIANHYRELEQRPLRRTEVQQAFYSGNKTIIKPIVELLWQDIKATSLYPKYVNELSYLYEMIQREETWQEQLDFRRNWKIKSTAGYNS